MTPSPPPSPSATLPPSSRLRRASIAGVLLLASLAAAWYAWNARAERALATEVITAIDAGLLDDAESRLAVLRSTRGETAQGAFLDARILVARGKLQEALVALKTARERGYPQPPMERLLGLIFARSGNAREAEPRLEAAWDARSGPDPQVAEALCRIYFDSYRFAPAIRVINGWLADSPRDLRGLLWRAEIHGRNEAGAEAQVADYDAILAVDPNQAPARLGRADALRQLGRHDEALAEYDRYIAAAPRDPMGHLGAAKAAEGLGDDDRALSYYDKAQAIDPNAGLLGKAVVLIRRRAYDDALKLIARAIAREPNDPENYYQQGLALDRLGKADEARAAFAHHKKIQAEQKRMETIRRGLVRDPRNVPLMVEASAWLFAHGYADEGVTWAEKALGVDPVNAPALKLLADHYAARGDVGRANFYRSQLPKAPSP